MGGLHVGLGEVFSATFGILFFAAPVLQLDAFPASRTSSPTVLCSFLQTCMEEMSEVRSAFPPSCPSVDSQQITSWMWHLGDPRLPFQAGSPMHEKATRMSHLEQTLRGELSEGSWPGAQAIAVLHIKDPKKALTCTERPFGPKLRQLPKPMRAQIGRCRLPMVSLPKRGAAGQQAPLRGCIASTRGFRR